MSAKNVIKNLRIKVGLTQDELAAELKTGQSTICQYESGAREPSIKNAHKIMKYAESRGIKINIEDLFTE